MKTHQKLDGFSTYTLNSFTDNVKMVLNKIG